MVMESFQVVLNSRATGPPGPDPTPELPKHSETEIVMRAISHWHGKPLLRLRAAVRARCVLLSRVQYGGG